MALSPNTRLSYSTLNDLPLVQLPADLLDKTMANVQGRKDITEQALLKSPDYIRQSATDRDLAEQINRYQEDIRTKLRDVAQSGDTSRYMQALGRAQNRLLEIYRPGGAADVLAKRKEMKTKRDAQLDETFKDNPRLAEYYKKTTPIPELNYNQSTGTYNQIGMPPIHRDIKDEDVADWFNQNLDNVKDSLLDSWTGDKGLLKQQLDGITDVYDFWKLKGVTKDKLQMVLSETFPDDFKESIYQKEKADRYFSGDTDPIDTKIWVKDPDNKGKYKLNPNNPISKLINGYSSLGARENWDSELVKDQDEIGLEWYKNSLDSEAEDQAGFIIKTIPSSKGVADDVEFYVDNSGNLITTSI